MASGILKLSRISRVFTITAALEELRRRQVAFPFWRPFTLAGATCYVRSVSSRSQANQGSSDKQRAHGREQGNGGMGTLARSSRLPGKLRAVWLRARTAFFLDKRL